MRILLTGATGFLGQAWLSANSHEFVTLGRHRPANFHGDWIEADFSGPLPVFALPKQIDAVVHLAQSNQYRSFPGGGPDMFAVNVACTARLLDWAVTAGAQRFIYASTGNVYGPHPGRVTEADAPNVRGQFYAASKLAGESLVAGYAGVLATCSLRLFGLYGPGQPQDKMLGTLISRVCSGQPITLQGDGEGYVSQPTYVADVLAVLEAALVEQWQGCVNVAGPQSASIQRLALLIGQAVGREPVFQHLDGTPPAPILPDLTRLHALVPEMAFTSLEHGIGLTAAALRAEQ